MNDSRKTEIPVATATLVQNVDSDEVVFKISSLTPSAPTAVESRSRDELRSQITEYMVGDDSDLKKLSCLFQWVNESVQQQDEEAVDFLWNFVKQTPLLNNALTLPLMLQYPHATMSYKKWNLLSKQFSDQLLEKQSDIPFLLTCTQETRAFALSWGNDSLKNALVQTVLNENKRLKLEAQIEPVIRTLEFFLNQIRGYTDYPDKLEVVYTKEGVRTSSQFDCFSSYLHNTSSDIYNKSVAKAKKYLVRLDPLYKERNKCATKPTTSDLIEVIATLASKDQVQLLLQQTKQQECVLTLKNDPAKLKLQFLTIIHALPLENFETLAQDPRGQAAIVELYKNADDYQKQKLREQLNSLRPTDWVPIVLASPLLTRTYPINTVIENMNQIDTSEQPGLSDKVLFDITMNVISSKNREQAVEHLQSLLPKIHENKKIQNLLLAKFKDKQSYPSSQKCFADVLLPAIYAQEVLENPAYQKNVGACDLKKIIGHLQETNSTDALNSPNAVVFLFEALKTNTPDRTAIVNLIQQTDTEQFGLIVEHALSNSSWTDGLRYLTPLLSKIIGSEQAQSKIQRYMKLGDATYKPEIGNEEFAFALQLMKLEQKAKLLPKNDVNARDAAEALHTACVLAFTTYLNKKANPPVSTHTQKEIAQELQGAVDAAIDIARPNLSHLPNWKNVLANLALHVLLICTTAGVGNLIALGVSYSKTKNAFFPFVESDSEKHIKGLQDAVKGVTSKK